MLSQPLSIPEDELIQHDLDYGFIIQWTPCGCQLQIRATAWPRLPNANACVTPVAWERVLVVQLV